MMYRGLNKRKHTPEWSENMKKSEKFLYYTYFFIISLDFSGEQEKDFLKIQNGKNEKFLIIFSDFILKQMDLSWWYIHKLQEWSR